MAIISKSMTFITGENTVSFNIDKQFPLKLPNRDGALMELWDIAPVVIIKASRLTDDEINAFNSGPKIYSYLEYSSKPPIAAWVFAFPGLGKFDATFNAKIVDTEKVDNFLDTTGGINNGVLLFLVDGNILKSICKTRLSDVAVKLFHSTIRKQLSLEYDMTDFKSCVTELYNKFTTKQLLERGRKFWRK